MQTLKRLPDSRIVLNYQHQRHHLSRYFLRRSLFSRARKSDVAAHVGDFALRTTRPPVTTARLREQRSHRAPRRDSEFMCRRNVRRGIVCNSPVGGAARNRVRDRSSCRAVCGSFHSLVRRATPPLVFGCNYRIYTFQWHAFRHSCNIDLRLNLRYPDIITGYHNFGARNTSPILDKKFASPLIFTRLPSVLHCALCITWQLLVLLNELV